MKALRKYAVPAIALAAIVTMFLVPEAAMAAEEIKDVAQRLDKNVQALKSLTLSVIFMVGLVVFGVGVWMIYKDSKEPDRGHAKTGMIAMLVGAIMLAVPTAIGVTGSSIFGSDKAEENVTKSGKF